jgi:tight adherence protein B
MFIAAACFVGVFALFVGIYWAFVVRPEGQAERVLARRLNPGEKQKKRDRLPLMKRIAPRSTVPMLEQVLRHSGVIVQPVERLIEQTGVRTSVGQLVLASAFLASVAGALTLLLSRNIFISVPVAMAVATVPYVVLRHLARRRLAKFEEQFPEAIDLIARALRAGHALTTGLGMVVDEMQDPVRTEFRLLYDRQNFGMPLPEAFKSLADRVPLLDARFFVTAVLTQRESGGNLAEVLDSLASLIRERFRIKRQVRTLSAHGRITGWVLASLPFAITGILFLLAPEFIGKLFTDPLGLRMVAVAVVLQVIGFIAMRRIINIEI